MTGDIASRLRTVRMDIDAACTSAGREPDSVHLLAVSKTWPASAVKAALAAGQSAFGENYLQEAIKKVKSCPGVSWHFIGAIQSNKTREIASHFDWVHSVPSFKVARRLAEQRDPGMSPLSLLFQVNTSGEESKSGVQADEVEGLVGRCRSLPNISLKGLMTIPAAGVDSTPAFTRLAELRDSTAAHLGLESFTELSMGMSQDFRVAITCGATWIRIGTAIFGPRTNQQQNQ